MKSIDHDNTDFDYWLQEAEKEQYGAIRVALELSKTHHIIPPRENRESQTAEAD